MSTASNEFKPQRTMQHKAEVKVRQVIIPKKLNLKRKRLNNFGIISKNLKNLHIFKYLLT